MRPAGCTVWSASRMVDPWAWPALATVEKTLANGLRIVLAEDRTVPLVFLSWTSQAGFERDPAGLEGLASFTPLLLREGTAHRSGRQITRAVDDLGASLSSGCDWSSAFLNVGVLSCDLAPGAELLLDMACAPRFPDAAVTHLRQRRLADLERRGRDPHAIANDAFARALFGHTGYGRPSLGTPPTVQRFDAATIAAFHDGHYLPSMSCVALAGSFDADTAIDLVGSFPMPSTSRRAPPLPQPAAFTVQPRGGVRLVDVPYATQTEIRVGHGVAADSEHMPALEVLNAVLGGGLTGRLARSLRHLAGLTYYIRSRVTARRLGGVFVVETSVANDATAAALAAIRREIEQLRDELVPGDEVEQAKRRLVGAELRYLQDLTAVGRSLGPAALQNNPDYLRRRTRAIATAEPEDLRELARRCLRPESLVAVVVGPAEALQTQLSSDRSVSLESIS
jgi:zinc protease